MVSLILPSCGVQNEIEEGSDGQIDNMWVKAAKSRDPIVFLYSNKFAPAFSNSYGRKKFLSSGSCFQIFEFGLANFFSHYHEVIMIH